MKDLEKLYNKNKRTRDTVTIEIVRFYINDIPVCYSWYGSEQHPRQICKFYNTKNFGTIGVCGWVGEDIDAEHNKINKVPDFCPLHKDDSDSDLVRLMKYCQDNAIYI